MAVLSFNQAYHAQLKEVITLLNQSANSLKEATHLAYTLGEYTGTGDERDLVGKKLSKEIDGHIADINNTLKSAEQAEHKVAQNKMAAITRKLVRVENIIGATALKLRTDLHGDWKCEEQGHEIHCTSRKLGKMTISFKEQGNNIKLLIGSEPPEALINFEVNPDLVEETFNKEDIDGIALLIKQEADNIATRIPNLMKKYKNRMASSMDRIAFLEARIASLQARIASPVNLKNIMNAVEKHLKTNHKGLEGWGDWEGKGTLFQCVNERKGLNLSLEVKASGKDGMQADILISNDDGDDVVETSQKIHADMSDEASMVEAIHDFLVKQAKMAH